MFWELFESRKMGSQTKTRLNLHLLRPHWVLTAILLATVPVLPAPLWHSLSCYFCPPQVKEKSCPNITSECLPNQLCFSSRYHHGPDHVLSAQGCMDKNLCASNKTLSYRGVKYSVRDTCCCKDYCNEPPKSDANTGKTEEDQDLCKNYTSSRISTSPAAASNL
ncbi:Sperm acrosome membrane-associated protein 4 [Channa argus]|uniref:Sperm acrosome membrane-associated protein 4 n=1 Tax=Channa argus TaxID=215402 RepID=A0A6G1PF56_CHAAH|nr:Sperm acrosome membrane-associated protein 4 [Channa argus]